LGLCQQVQGLGFFVAGIINALGGFGLPKLGELFGAVSDEFGVLLLDQRVSITGEISTSLYLGMTLARAWRPTDAVFNEAIDCTTLANRLLAILIKD
jgi:hypothetical protein